VPILPLRTAGLAPVPAPRPAGAKVPYGPAWPPVAVAAAPAAVAPSAPAKLATKAASAPPAPALASVSAKPVRPARIAPVRAAPAYRAPAASLALAPQGQVGAPAFSPPPLRAAPPLRGADAPQVLPPTPMPTRQTGAWGPDGWDADRPVRQRSAEPPRDLRSNPPRDLRASSARDGYVRPYPGWRVPRAFRSPTYAVNDHARWGLPNPGFAREWVRYYDDAVLIDERGWVSDVRTGIDWNRPAMAAMAPGWGAYPDARRGGMRTPEEVAAEAMRGARLVSRSGGTTVYRAVDGSVIVKQEPTFTTVRETPRPARRRR
jgi:Ni/Co efflux regulator RcnB